MSSSLKPLEQFSPDFTWGLLSKGYCQFVQIIPCRSRWPSCPYMVKTLKNFSSPEPRKLWGWILVYSIEDSRCTKCVQMMTLSWPLTFLRQDQICVPMQLYGENVEKFFSQNVWKTNGCNLQCVIKVVKYFSNNQNFVLWGLSALATGLYTCIHFYHF